MLLEVLFAATVIMLVSLVGIIFIQKTTQKFLESKLTFLISFSAGVFLVTAGGLGLEVFQLMPSIWFGTGMIAIGYGLAFLLQALMPEIHHHHDEECAQNNQAARKLIIGDAIHNVVDGVVLVTAFAASSTLGLAAAISILIHEVLQEISEFFVLRQAGYSVRKALSINLAVSSTVLIGVVLGYFALVSKELEIILLAISAGFFLHVVIHDLLPKPDRHNNATQFFKHLALFVLGALLMGSIAITLGGGHA